MTSVIDKRADEPALHERGTTPVVVARGVSKTFEIPEQTVHTFKERALHPRRRIKVNHFNALKNINFEVYPGEFFGIAGRNGSGKSTLLKCIAGIYATEGTIWRSGRLSTFIELGIGFNADLAARDNVVMNGIMMGLSPREARKRFDQVIEFAELEEFKDLKLKNYSSGMHVRLAFSVAIQVDADMLLIDEVLAVGDASFQQKCFDVFNEMRDAGKTIVFVTHDMGSMRRFCHRAMLLEKGEMIYTGDPEDVGDRYLEINFGRDLQDSESGDHRGGDGDARVVGVWLEDEHGQRTMSVRQNQRITLKARVTFMTTVEDPSASVYVNNEEHRAILVLSTVHQTERTGRFTAGEELVLSFTFDNVLAPGRYSPVVSLAHRGAGVDLLDRFESSYTFVVSGTGALGGLVDLPVEVSTERGQSTALPELSS